jgi:hypothetical protein
MGWCGRDALVSVFKISGAQNRRLPQAAPQMMLAQRWGRTWTSVIEL